MSGHAESSLAEYAPTLGHGLGYKLGVQSRKANEDVDQKDRESAIEQLWRRTHFNHDEKNKRQAVAGIKRNRRITIRGGLLI
ncbi:MAG: hypothetical protein AAF911_14305 [Planctomycetota bacterium]